MDWICIHTTTDVFLFEQLKMVLDAHNINFKERNTVSSMYNNFGSYELYINKEYREEVEKILKDVTG